jgi:hypothetical protein
MRNIQTLVFLTSCLMVARASADTDTDAGVQLAGKQDMPLRLEEPDSAYIASRLHSLLKLEDCHARVLNQNPDKKPEVIYRELSLQHQSIDLHINVAVDVMRTGNMLIYAKKQPENKWFEYYDCQQEFHDALLPVLAIIATIKDSPADNSNGLRQQVLAHNTQLSSHEANQLMMRTDSHNESHPYLDFTLSLKHPLLANWEWLDGKQQKLADLVTGLVGIEDHYYLQPYVAFTGRFSQFIATRDSSPVLERRFNPSVFYRLWRSDETWFDVGLGHESNGQSINTHDAFINEQDRYRNRHENIAWARDGLSRGWDYSFIGWQQSWSTGDIEWQSHLQLRHYLAHGPFQGDSEEYREDVESDGPGPRPRKNYDGISLNLQYNFDKSHCYISTALGTKGICFKQWELTQETGYAALFKHNTTTLELTTDFFGLPVQLWSRTGYSSDMVDYYRYTKSWGLGIVLKTP